MQWTNTELNELYYYITKLIKLDALYDKKINFEARHIADTIVEILSPWYKGSDVVQAVKYLIEKNQKIPLPSQIMDYCDNLKQGHKNKQTPD